MLRHCEVGRNTILSRKTRIKLVWLLHRTQERREGGCQVMQVQGVEDFWVNLNRKKWERLNSFKEWHDMIQVAFYRMSMVKFLRFFRETECRLSQPQHH